jgi:hypothetical protein
MMGGYDPRNPYGASLFSGYGGLGAVGQQILQPRTTRYIQQGGKIYKLVSPSARVQKRRRFAPRRTQRDKLQDTLLTLAMVKMIGGGH